MTLTRTLAGALLATAAGVLLSGCIVVPGGRHGGFDGGAYGGATNGAYGGAYGGGGVYAGDGIRVAPPTPQVEVVGLAPGPGLIWIGGYWNWVGSRHVWVGGRWDAGRPGYHWQPHRWQRDRGGWRMNPGRWDRR